MCANYKEQQHALCLVRLITFIETPWKQKV